MTYLTNFNDFINESKKVKLSKINIQPESGSFKLKSQQKKVLEDVFRECVVGVEDKIKDAAFFESGYSGISFKFKGQNLYLMYSQGKVGSDDQTMGSLSLTPGGRAGNIIQTGPTYSSRGFGNTDIDNSHIEEFKTQFKKFLN